MFLDDDRVGLDGHVGMMQISEKHQSVLTAFRGATAEGTITFERGESRK